MPTTDTIVTFTSPKTACLLTDIRDSGPLSTDEIEGRTIASLISAGTELAMGYHGESFPFQPGYAAVFKVEAVGSEVTGIVPGDLAFVLGRHCSHQRCLARDAHVIPVGLDPFAATFARMMCVSMTTLTTTTARPPSSVLIAGLGPVGHMAARVFAASGYDVIGCDPAPNRREMLSGTGIRTVDSVSALTKTDDRPALAIDCSGNEQAVVDLCRAVRKGGEVVLIGVPWRRLTDTYAHDVLHAVFHNYVHLRSGWEWELPMHDTAFTTGSIHGSIDGALRWLANGRVDVTGLWETRCPTDCAAVYDDLYHARTQSPATIFAW